MAASHLSIVGRVTLVNLWPLSSVEIKEAEASGLDFVILSGQQL